MRWLGKYSWVKSVAIGVIGSASIFAMFEIWFKVPLYKGAWDPLAFLGYCLAASPAAFASSFERRHFLGRDQRAVPWCRRGAVAFQPAADVDRHRARRDHRRAARAGR